MVKTKSSSSYISRRCGCKIETGDGIFHLVALIINFSLNGCRLVREPFLIMDTHNAVASMTVSVYLELSRPQAFPPVESVEIITFSRL